MNQVNTKRFFLFPLVIAIVMTSLEMVPFILFNQNISGIPSVLGYAAFWIISGIAVLSSFIVSYYVLQPLTTRSNIKLTTILAAFFLSLLTTFLISQCLVFVTNPEYRPRIEIYAFPRSFFTSLIVTTYTYFAKLNYLKQTYELEIEVLKKQNLESQYEALKNELSPHFLFNSLNALQAIIGENQAAAKDYVFHLSTVLRNTLQSNVNQFITLKEELKLANSYLYLLNIRYGNNLKVSIDIPDEYQSGMILPLTIQLLVENAVKHNEISTARPLSISVKVNDNGKLTVSNNLQRKETQESSLGIGLSNLVQRYRMLCGRDVSITMGKDFFNVELPLTIS